MGMSVYDMVHYRRMINGNMIGMQIYLFNDAIYLKRLLKLIRFRMFKLLNKLNASRWMVYILN